MSLVWGTMKTMAWKKKEDDIISSAEDHGDLPLN